MRPQPRATIYVVMRVRTINQEGKMGSVTLPQLRDDASPDVIEDTGTSATSSSGSTLLGHHLD